VVLAKTWFAEVSWRYPERTENQDGRVHRR